MRRINFLIFSAFVMFSIISACSKDEAGKVTPAEYELVFTDTDGHVFRSSDLLCDLPREELYEGVFYEGGKCFMDNAEDENLVRGVYGELLEAFNLEYGQTMGTYAFVPLHSIIGNMSTKAVDDITDTTQLSESYAEEVTRVFTGIRDEWAGKEPIDSIRIDFGNVWEKFKEKPLDYKHFNDSFVSFLSTAQNSLTSVMIRIRKYPVEKWKADPRKPLVQMLNDDISRLGQLNRFVKHSSNPLPGLFSVSFDKEKKTIKKVYFSPGNLWADDSNWTVPIFHFEANQWQSYPLEDAKSEKKHISHFAWSSSASGAARMEGGGTNLFCDEKHKLTVDGQSGYYVLSHKEWNYLFRQRRNSGKLNGFATITPFHGIVILPDDFKDPYAETRPFIPVSDKAGWDANVYSVAEWQGMEAAGAVFLPAAGFNQLGFSSNYDIVDVGKTLRYYTSSAQAKGDASYALLCEWDSYRVNTNSFCEKIFGCSLRLVRDSR